MVILGLVSIAISILVLYLKYRVVFTGENVRGQ